jgi:uncharacterized membrane protein
MIQRIQTIWLFLAAALNGLLFISPLYKYNFGTLGLAYSPYREESVNTYWPLLVVAVIMTLLPLVAIFFFKDRKRQKGLVWLSILSIIAFLVLMFMRVSNLKNATPPATNLTYVLPGFVPCIIALLFLFFAIAGIRKDDKLIKSLDRLR